MAITVRTYPESFNPVYNRIELSATSTNVAQPNFKFVFRLYVDGTLEATFKVTPDPSNYGYIDVSRYLASFIKEEIQDPSSTVFHQYALSQPVERFRVDVLEEYGTTPAIDDESLITGDDVYAWSASFKYHDWVNQKNESVPFDEWLQNETTGDAYFLTNLRNHYVSINDIGYLYVLTDDPTNYDYTEIKTYGASGLIQTVQLQNPLAVTDESRMQAIMCAPESLNNTTTALALGSQPIITSSVTYYTIQNFKTGAADISEVIRFTIQEPCKFDQYRIHFLNELGGFDAYNFQARSQESSVAQRKKYTRAENFFNGVGAVEWNHRQNGTSDYFVKSRDQVKLRTDWLDETTHTWLKELIESPLVYLEFTNLAGNQDFKPVYVKTSNWSKQDIEIDKLFKLEIDIDLGHENFRQRR